MGDWCLDIDGLVAPAASSVVWLAMLREHCRRRAVLALPSASIWVARSSRSLAILAAGLSYVRPATSMRAEESTNRCARFPARSELFGTELVPDLSARLLPASPASLCCPCDPHRCSIQPKVTLFRPYDSRGAPARLSPIRDVHRLCSDSCFAEAAWYPMLTVPHARDS